TATRTTSRERAATSTGSSRVDEDPSLPDTRSLEIVDSADEVPGEEEVALQAAAMGRGKLKLSIDDLIALRAQNVTPEQILQMRSLFPAIQPSEIAGMAAVGATPEFVARMRAAGLDVDSPSDATGLAAVGATPEFTRGMRAAGLAVESAGQAQGLAAVGVTPKFIREMRESGLPVETPEEAQGLAAVGVTADFIREMRTSGLAVESAE